MQVVRNNMKHNETLNYPICTGTAVQNATYTNTVWINPMWTETNHLHFCH
mgnify:CR=1 FL=1